MRSIVLGGVALGGVPTMHSFGWALVRLEPEHETVESLGVIRTRLRYGAGDAPDAADTTARARWLASLVRVVALREELVGIVRATPAELEVSDARVHGIVDALSVELDVPIVDVDAAEARDAVADAQLEEARTEGWIEILDDDETPVQLRRWALEAVAAVRLGAARTEALRAARQLARRVG